MSCYCIQNVLSLAIRFLTRFLSLSFQNVYLLAERQSLWNVNYQYAKRKISNLLLYSLFYLKRIKGKSPKLQADENCKDILICLEYSKVKLGAVEWIRNCILLPLGRPAVEIANYTKWARQVLDKLHIYQPMNIILAYDERVCVPVRCLFSK